MSGRRKGTQSEKGDRCVERIMSFKLTCQICSLPSFPLLVGAIDSISIEFGELFDKYGITSFRYIELSG